MYQVVLAFCFVKKFIKFIRLSSDFSMACNQGLPSVKNICGPQLNDSTILDIKSEKYRPDLALTLSIYFPTVYLCTGLFLILHIKYWSTYLYGVISA